MYTVLIFSRAKLVAKTILSTAVSTLAALEHYFEVPFMLPKLDFIAVPEMLLVGMEHVGCCFLHIQTSDDEAIDTLEKDTLHEIAHQWIGNFVGMSLKMKEGIVQHLEKTFSEKLFGNDPSKKPKKKRSQVKTLSKANANPAR